MEYFDTHAHYDDKKFEDDREEVLNKIYNAGVTKCINMGCDIKSSKIAIKIANNHNKSVAQVILRWDYQNGVIVIPGSSNPEHIKENISIFFFYFAPQTRAGMSA